MGFRKVRQIFNLPRSNTRQPLCIKSLHNSTRRNRRLKYLKGRGTERFREIRQLHPISTIRLVDSVGFHRFTKSHPWEGNWNFHPTYLTPNPLDQPLNQSVNVFPPDKRHLQIDLGKFRLPIRPQILIPKTSRYLKILFRTPHHQELLELLRRLGQRIKFSGVQPGRNQILPRPFRCAFKKNRRFNFPEAFLMQVVPDCQSGPMPCLQGLCHRRPTQIQIPVTQSQILIHTLLIQRKGRSLTRI